MMRCSLNHTAIGTRVLLLSVLPYGIPGLILVKWVSWRRENATDMAFRCDGFVCCNNLRKSFVGARMAGIRMKFHARQLIILRGTSSVDREVHEDPNL